MKDKIKVFISYNHQDKNFLNSLLQVMRNNQFKELIEPLFDEVLTENPSNLYGNISKLLNKSHVAVAIITKNWLKSHNTRDEFIRAHERRKKLFCIFKSDDDINENQIPHYIKGDLRFEFHQDNFEYIAAVLCNSLLNFNNHWQLKIFDKLRLLGDLFEIEGNKEVLTHFTIKHFEQKMLNTVNELDSIVKDQFSVNVSYEQNFLETAKPYFQTAKKIYAVSLIGVSTFWTDKDTPLGIKKSYLDAHVGENKEVIRLFVFNSPVEANKYKNVLQANYKHYGQKKGGNVLFCSFSSYEIFLTRTFFNDQEFLANSTKRDFGILYYDEGENEIVHEAILENGRMNIRKLDLKNPNNFTRTLFINEISNKVEELEKFGIIRWEQKYYDDKNEWREALQKVFEHHTTTVKEAVHMVFFKVNKNIEEKFKDIITELLLMIEKKKGILNIGSFYFRNKTKNVFSVTDGRWGGKLIFTNDFNYSISIVFNDKKTLPDYYRDLEHSDLRRSLYELLNPDVCDEFKLLDTLHQKKNDEFDENEIYKIDSKIQQNYRDIEILMSKFILRFDWENYITFERIASVKGYDFLGYDK